MSHEEQLIWRTRSIAYGVIAPMLIAVGLLGNVLTIFVLKNKRFTGRNNFELRSIGQIFCDRSVVYFHINYLYSMM